MKTEPLSIYDLERISALQPSDWSDIIPFFSFYLNAAYCDPIKVEIDNHIIGVGSAIKYKGTAWIAHIIVHPDYRRRGIGTVITNALVETLKVQGFKTVSLIATNMGEPVYRKAGFVKETEYLFFRDGQCVSDATQDVSIIPYNQKYLRTVLALDKMGSGENREVLLSSHLSGSLLYKKGKTIHGFCMPSLGEGLIIADHPDAGIALMKMKYATVSKAVLPSENEAGIDFLLKSSFQEYSRGTRMCLGKRIRWVPEMLYSRIGGNLG